MALRGVVLVALLLAGCGSRPHTGPNLAAAYSYPGLSCAPFARALTGLALAGDAAGWWGQSSGRYARSGAPAVGAVLVFRREGRLPSGHVSVVSRVLDERHIHVIQANWVPGELDEDQLIVDVSPRNDWTEVRVWYPPTDQLGTHSYATFGFIVPPRPLGHDALAAGAEPAARAVTGLAEPRRSRALAFASDPRYATPWKHRLHRPGGRAMSNGPGPSRNGERDG